MRRTDLFLFESAYSRDVFRRKVGDPGGIAENTDELIVGLRVSINF